MSGNPARNSRAIRLLTQFNRRVNESTHFASAPNLRTEKDRSNHNNNNTVVSRLSDTSTSYEDSSLMFSPIPVNDFFYYQHPTRVNISLSVRLVNPSSAADAFPSSGIFLELA